MVDDGVRENLLTDMTGSEDHYIPPMAGWKVYFLVYFFAFCRS